MKKWIIILGIVSVVGLFMVSLQLVYGDHSLELGEHADIKRTVASVIHGDCDSAEVTYSLDNHGGFHGDGVAIYHLDFPDHSLLDTISEDTNWQGMPYDDNIQVLLGRYLIEDGEAI